MDLLEIISKTWPILVAFVMIVVLFAKMDVRIGVLEEKVKALFDLINKK